MAFSLSRLTRALETRTITVRGEAVEIRALTAAEAFRLEAQYPSHNPPLTLDPDKGVKAPMVLDFKNREWQEEQKRRQRVLKCGAIAIATGMERISDKSTWTPAVDQKWLEGLAEELAGLLTIREIDRVFEHISRLDESSVPDPRQRIGDEVKAGN